MNDGQIRAKFIVVVVALAPGLHRQAEIKRLFQRSSDPDQTFRDLEAVIARRIGSVDIEGLN